MNVTEEFDRAQDERKKRRLELNGIRDRVNSHLDEQESYEVNFQEVEDLCQMIDDKDRTLLNDLSKIRDLLNQRKIDQEGFTADATTVSSIMINQI